MKILSISILLILIILLSACGGNSTTPAAASGKVGQSTLAALTVTSTDFASNAPIPEKYTCQGDDSSPALAWTAPPAGTKSLALILDDPDAPVGTWVHWVVYNLPADTTSLPGGASKANAASFTLPQGTVQGKTSFNRADYGGPCPPSGTHHYRFHLYALDTTLQDGGLDKAGLLKSMNGHVLAEGELVGLYSKK
jgi:Raf kinase inhibitor-like YbhB/YbcL family protein